MMREGGKELTGTAQRDPRVGRSQPRQAAAQVGSMDLGSERAPGAQKPVRLHRRLWARTMASGAPSSLLRPLDHA